MAADERELEQELDDFDADVDGAEDKIDGYLRVENGGQEPDHPAYWHAHAPNGKRHLKRARP
jgi:hypothetical protein